MNIAHIFCFDYHDLNSFACALGQYSQHTHVVVCLAQEPDFKNLPIEIQGWYGWHALVAATQWADLVHFHWKKPSANLVSIAAEHDTTYINTLYAETDIGDPAVLTVCVNETINDYNGNPSNSIVIPQGVSQQPTKNHSPHNRSDFIIICLTPSRQTALFFWEPVYRLLGKHPQVELWLGGTERQAAPSHPQVRMLGQQFDSDKHLSASDVLVCPIYTRGHGSRLTIDGADTSIKRALAAGCPVIATDTGLTRELIRHDETGFLIPFGDGVTLYDSLEKLITNRVQLASMSTAAAANNIPSTQQIVVQYDEIYALFDATNTPPAARTQLSAQVSDFLAQTRTNKVSEKQEIARAMSDICRQTDTAPPTILGAESRVSAIAPPPPMRPSEAPEPQFESLKSFGYEIGESEQYISKRLLVENKRAVGNIVFQEINGFVRELVQSGRGQQR